MVPRGITGPDITRDPGGSAGHPHQCGSQQLHYPWTSTWIQAVAQAMNIHVVFGGSVVREINSDPDGAGPWTKIWSWWWQPGPRHPHKSQVAEQATYISMVPGAAQPTDISMDSGHTTCSGTNICMPLSDDTTLGHQPEPWPHRGHWLTHRPSLASWDKWSFEEF